MAGPQVRLGGGWNCDPSQTTAGEATADGDRSGDEAGEDGAAHPRFPMATKTSGITNLFMESQSVQDPCGFLPAPALRGLGVALPRFDGQLDYAA